MSFTAPSAHIRRRGRHRNSRSQIVTRPVSSGKFALRNREYILARDSLGLLFLLPQSTITAESGRFPAHSSRHCAMPDRARIRPQPRRIISQRRLHHSQREPAFSTGMPSWPRCTRPGGDGSFSRPLPAHSTINSVKTFAGTSPLIWHTIGLALHLLGRHSHISTRMETLAR